MAPTEPLTAPELNGLLQAVAVHLERTPGQISVSFVDETTIRQLNRGHRGEDQVTDVLSFPFGPEFPQGVGGEVLVCEPVARRQAAARGIAPRDELAMLVVHGSLHVYGMEDATAAGGAAMERATQAILNAVWSEISE